MLNVYILEDDPIQAQQIQNYLRKISTELSVDLTMQAFTATQDLYRNFPKADKHNLFLLDLEINGVKKAGLEASRHIRQHDPDATIIFMTTHEEFLYHTYKYRVGALDFIAKDLDNIYHELKCDLQQVTARLQTSNHELPFIYHDYSNTIKIDFMNINFFESNAGNSHSSILNTANNQQRQLNYNLREIEKIDSRFFRAHRSYLINPRQVKQVDAHRGLIYFNNGSSCPVSKLHVHELLKLITNNY